jgi:hypothetical protein
MTITNFTGNGIELKKGGGHVVSGNTIESNGRSGIAITKVSAKNTIGGAAGEGNTIVSNAGGGISIRGEGATDNLVDSNTISGNTGYGVGILNKASGNIIGKIPGLADPSTGNIIISNKGTGVSIGLGAKNNQVRGNRIGMDPDRFQEGLIAGNTGDGVRISDASNNTIGGEQADFRNVISANRGNGVVIQGASADGNSVLGNYLGTNLTGQEEFDGKGNFSTGNKLDGVYIFGATNSQVGNAKAGNVISANLQKGVEVQGGSKTALVNNRIGATADGSDELVNADIAVVIQNTTRTTYQDNKGFHVRDKRAVLAAGNKMLDERNNDIRRQAPRDGGVLGPAVPNTTLLASSDVTLGGALPGAGNVFDDTLEVLGSSNVLIQGNFLGVDASGTALGNGGDGIFIDGASTGVTLGGPGAGAGNVLGGNAGAGVRLDGAALLQANGIGSNNGTGVVVEGGANAQLAQNALASLVVSGGTATFLGGNTVAAVTVSGGTLALLNPGDSLAVLGAYTQTAGVSYLNPGSALTVSGALAEQGGQLLVYAATVQVNGRLSIQSGALLDGWGTITADVTNAGTLVAHAYDTGGTLHLAANASLGIGGNYTQTSSGRLSLEVDSLRAVDQLLIDGQATLDGALNVSLLSSYSPSAGDTFNLLTYGSRSGTFATVNLPSFSGGSFVARYDTPANTFSLQAVSG